MNEINNEFVKIYESNGILWAEYKEIYIDIDVAKKVLECRNKFTSDKDLPMILNTTKLKGIDKESRDFFSKPEGSVGLTAVAMIVKSSFARWLVSFLLSINLKKNDLPMKVFNDESQAEKWLSQYK